MIELFAYGTLCDPEYRQALFDRCPATRPATLHDWVAVVLDNGYLSLVRAPGEHVAGELLALDDAALALADAWEQVPAYERLTVEARDERGNPVAAYVYVKPTTSRERARSGLLAENSREHVLAQIRRCRALYDRTNSERA